MWAIYSASSKPVGQFWLRQCLSSDDTWRMQEVENAKWKLMKMGEDDDGEGRIKRKMKESDGGQGRRKRKMKENDDEERKKEKKDEVQQNTEI